MEHDEEVVMTPTKKGKTTTIKIAKVRKNQVDQTKVAHKAGGQHSGLVINKQSAEDAPEPKPDLQLEFKCFLVDHKTGDHVPESRVLKFWFAPDTDYLDKITGSYEFFKELVKPDQFPRDYVGFIKKVMKQIRQPQYGQMKKVDVDLRQLEAEEAGPPPNPDHFYMQSEVDSETGLPREDTRPREVVVQEQLLHTLESAYPNILPFEDLASMTGASMDMVQDTLAMLQGRNLIKEMEPGKWVRKVLDEQTEVKVVKNMPIQTGANKPTIAVITSKYYEKLCVDSMMEDKTTFVKYKTEGESNVYTIGNIGAHKVVSTKLPMIGRQMAAQISSGNTTTRLLGTFGDIEYVLLVGVVGGVPHYTDYNKDCHLGDVIISTPDPKGYSYIFCDKINEDEQRGTLSYSLKSWIPRDLVMNQIADDMLERRNEHCPWHDYIRDGQQLLQGQEVNFQRPPPNSDRLFMNIGGADMIEVGHPPLPEDAPEWLRDGQTVLRTGPIGAGKPIVKDDSLRQDFAARHNCVAFDTEFDQCLESIVGNRKDSFLFVRGVSDYLDGSKPSEWQPYSALAAASVMKALIERLPPPN